MSNQKCQNSNNNSFRSNKRSRHINKEIELNEIDIEDHFEEEEGENIEENDSKNEEVSEASDDEDNDKDNDENKKRSPIWEHFIQFTDQEGVKWAKREYCG